MNNPNFSAWNTRQKQLRALLADRSARDAAVALFLDQHAATHAGGLPDAPGVWSAEDDVWFGRSAADLRCIPPGEEHSVVWISWHLSRCEDITMNMLVAGAEQVLFTEDWHTRIGAPARDTGSAMDPPAIAAFSAQADPAAVRAYRAAVALRTRAIARGLSVTDLRRKPDPARVAWVLACGAVDPTQTWLTDYWGNQTAAGLLLMPASRHAMVHWNEAYRQMR
jgi:hypothetical protein